MGLVGFGRLARRYYLPAFRLLRDIEVVAVADPLAPSLDAARAALPRAASYEDHREMLAREALDALLVASPPSTHLETWTAAAARGLPVFMEKPFVLEGELPAVEQTAAAAPLLMVDFNRRFWPLYRKMGEMLRAGAVGRPTETSYLLHVDVRPWCTVTSHRLMPDEGGVLYDLGSQAIDLVSNLVGEAPVCIHAETRTRRWRDDHVRLDLTLPSGARVRCDLAYAERTRERLCVRGPGGTLRLDDPNMTVRLERGAASATRLAGRLQDGAAFAYRALRPGRAMARASIADALAAFERALRNRTPLCPGFGEAMANARLLEAARQSAASGAPVAAAPGS